MPVLVLGHAKKISQKIETESVLNRLYYWQGKKVARDQGHTRDYALNELGEIVMLNIQTRKMETVAIVSVSGQIVVGETDSLFTIVQSLDDVRAVILDLAGVSIIDASGLGILLKLRERAQAKGIRFELMNVGKWVNKVLKVVCLDSVFNVTSGVESFPMTANQRRTAMPRLASCA
jgi:anti-anti-sigma factor